MIAENVNLFARFVIAEAAHQGFHQFWILIVKAANLVMQRLILFGHAKKIELIADKLDLTFTERRQTAWCEQQNKRCHSTGQSQRYPDRT